MEGKRYPAGCPWCAMALVFNGYYQVGYCQNEKCGISFCLIHEAVFAVPGKPEDVECGACKVRRLAIETGKEHALNG
jgi:hypothetical protein